MPTQPTPERGQRCPTCAGVARLKNSMMDVKTNKTVRLFECSKCGHFWDD